MFKSVNFPMGRLFFPQPLCFGILANPYNFFLSISISDFLQYLYYSHISKLHDSPAV